MAPRVVVLSLASDFGCQVQMTNIEDDLLDVLGLIDLGYWQLASSGHMPEDYDVALVEGAVTTEEHVELLRRVRRTADTVIAVGACALTGGIPALASRGELGDRLRLATGEGAFDGGPIAPRPVTAVVDVDYWVPGCPIDTDEFLKVLSRALSGLAERTPEQPLCFACKTRENICFFERGELCLGVLVRSGCHARCVALGRPCTGCRGLSPEANLPSARAVFAEHGWDADEVRRRLSLYNSNEEVVL